MGDFLQEMVVKWWFNLVESDLNKQKWDPIVSIGDSTVLGYNKGSKGDDFLICFELLSWHICFVIYTIYDIFFCFWLVGIQRI